MNDVYIHPTAVVDEGAELGPGTKVWHFVHVSAKAKLGRDCSLGQNVFVANGVTLGDGVRVQNNVSIYTGVEVADGAFLGPSCVFTNVINPRSFVSRKDEYKDTKVGKGASVGANATIVCGNDLGDYAFVGAGAVVTRDVPAYALMMGVPARRVGWMCQCGVRLPDRSPDGAEVVCQACGRRYRITDERCEPIDNE
ncbi:MAG: acyltransferase [Myxococcota bacterium]